MKSLFKAIASLKTSQECAKFMRDLCTIAELEEMAERWQVAREIENEIPYREISKNTGVSTATITRVAHWVHHGEGGYRNMLQKMNT
ncbi:hypothetical protein HZA38_01495 [Candidatus Peregrinibacteria bacterium]|nr:hypothetical protein [Candidatus Peregrinibacteria bacterium]